MHPPSFWRIDGYPLSGESWWALDLKRNKKKVFFTRFEGDCDFRKNSPILFDFSKSNAYLTGEFLM
jgi:hypothetical protein